LLGGNYSIINYDYDAWEISVRENSDRQLKGSIQTRGAEEANQNHDSS
jgi:hypothetical protein